MVEHTTDAREESYAFWSSQLESRIRGLLAQASDLSPDDREDILADARECVVVALETRSESIAHREAYAWTVARNFVAKRVTQMRRYRESTRPLDGTEESEPRDPEATADSSAADLVQEAILRLMHMLPPDEQNVLRACFSGDQPISHTAKSLGVPRTTVTSRLVKAIRSLRGALLKEAKQDPRLADGIATLWGEEALGRLSSRRLGIRRVTAKRRHDSLKPTL